MKSWVESANQHGTDFPLENLPYGVCRYDGRACIGIAIGDQILDVTACAEQGLLAAHDDEIRAACAAESLNALMSLGPRAWSSLRREVTTLLGEEAAAAVQSSVTPILFPMRDAEMQLPARIGDYTDFYASIYHATRVGRIFRPENPLLPNYKYLPIGYHGRASSIVVSGTEVLRPCGQMKLPSATGPALGPTQSLDYELEVGFFIGVGNPMGRAIPIAEAEQHIFGLCLLNDWSARDIQSWEYQPLGPFLAKNFATTISPWIVPMEALNPYRVATPDRPPEDPAALAYLASPHQTRAGIDLTLVVFLQSEKMRLSGFRPVRLSSGNLRDLYWNLDQLVAHHTVNGCNLRPGDLLGTGTVSGAAEGSEGCLLEMQHREQRVTLPTGETRRFLEDGDEIVIRGFCQRPGLPRIGFGECSGRVAAPRCSQQ